MNFFSKSDCDLPPNIKFEDQSCYAKWFPGEKYISLNKANRLIQERAKVVFAVPGDRWGESYDPTYDTHQALLICVEEIFKDSAEKILKTLMEEYPSHHLCDRAKRLLGGGK